LNSHPKTGQKSDLRLGAFSEDVIVASMMVSPPTKAATLLSRPVNSLWGVGLERAALLTKLDIRTVEDLLLHRPRRYEDRRHFRSIAELQLNEPSIAQGKILALGVKWFKQHTKSIFELVLDDGTGRLHCRWWNLPFLEKHFNVGDEVVLFGQLRSFKPRTMDHPETEIVEGGEERFIHLGRIIPIYPLTEGLPQRWLRGLIWRTLQQPGLSIPAPWKDDELARLSPAFPSRADAIRWLHFPEQIEQVELARRRLALDEFVALQTQIQIRRRNLQTKGQAIPCPGDNHLIKPFLARLGFKLTDSQTSVLRELRKELSGPHPMRRLLQGDVGSGKTIVAGCCALMAIESGHNVALMAPTEILAEQHHLNFSRWLKSLGVVIELRTSSHKAGVDRERELNRGAHAAAGEQHGTLTIGTHALLGPAFEQNNLGLVIIDEQHKFGVSQREQLVRKGRYPHLLVMTATPIPRTLGLTLYGDLDLSTLNQLPPGRGTIQTFVRNASSLPKVWSFVRSQLKEKRQVYVVYPRVDQTIESDLKGVIKELDILKEALAPFRVGLIHGRLTGKEKEKVMAAFRSHQLDVLLATSLIEVGVDVPNATVMVVQNAEQFGLAQLHQLRGRIGRGSHNSYCVLVAAAKTRQALERLRVLEESTDGFKIAEADLKLRGPGELLGQEQSGAPRFRFGDLITDMPLIEQAREIAKHLLSKTA
jgi:ATP-dependent DNA helicase RecG